MRSSGAVPTLGILTLYLDDNGMLEERSVYAKMIRAGKRLGMRVFVFTPRDVDEQNGRIHALTFQTDTRTWSRQWTKFPHVIYDRCRIQKSERFRELLAFRKRNGHRVFLNRPLRNKWTVCRALAKVAAFRPHLPTTRLYRSPLDVADMLKRYSTVYFKPVGGTGGRGILRIDRHADGSLTLQGRNHSRRIVEPRRIARHRLSAVIDAWDKRGDRYIVQQGLNLKLPNGRVHDYRMLVQKNSRGVWEFTGCAGRVGPSRSITSNLHGGGEAVPMNALLRQWMGSEAKQAQIRETAERFGLGVAKYLEATYGDLCELALDLAIDRSGRVWLLEVNPKPSREVFLRAGEESVYRTAIQRPIEYGLWVYRQRYGGASKTMHRSSVAGAGPAPSVEASQEPEAVVLA